MTTGTGRAVFISCEHGGNGIPPKWRESFRGCQVALDSHRGYDPGALVMAEAMAEAFSAPLIATQISRLLVDCNRSRHHPRLHGAAVRRLPAAQRFAIVEEYYLPYRRRVAKLLEDLVSRHGQVLHIACHSFTPVLDGRVRNADIGLLYDPGRWREAGLCARWKACLRAAAPHLRVRRNYPYRGSDDGLTTWLRTQLPAAGYIGLELELNQSFCAAPARSWSGLRATVIAALQSAMDSTNL